MLNLQAALDAFSAMLATACGVVLLAPPLAAQQSSLAIRVQVQPFRNSQTWQPATASTEFSGAGSAIIVCDMWDRHWCRGATNRVEALARRMDPVLRRARQAGVLIIHAPSETMEFYKSYPQRQLVANLPAAGHSAGLKLLDPLLPIDDSDGGCDTPGDNQHKAWTREIALLSLGSDDAISDNGEEIYSLLRKRNIRTVFIMGVHANMCILNRSFAIKQMTRWGLHCVLVRDLTDAMYNPARRPFVSHEAGTQLVVEHIEKYWCPSTLSTDLLAAMDRVRVPAAEHSKPTPGQ